MPEPRGPEYTIYLYIYFINLFLPTLFANIFTSTADVDEFAARRNAAAAAARNQSQSQQSEASTGQSETTGKLFESPSESLQQGHGQDAHRQQDEELEVEVGVLHIMFHKSNNHSSDHIQHWNLHEMMTTWIFFMVR